MTASTTLTPTPPTRRWQLPALLLVTVITLLTNFGINGWGNQYYAAATWASTVGNLQTFFFGAFDPSNAITVDKPPLSLWLMDVSAHIFGFNTFALLVPQLLCALSAVYLLYRLVGQIFGTRAALIAGTVLALTPVWIAVFRFNDPDALLVTLLLGAVTATVTLNRTAHTRWALLVGALFGLAFLTKYMQAFLILPAVGLGYLLFGQPRLARRLLHLLTALFGLLLAGGWWPLIVTLTSSHNRPYLGGSGNNTLLDVIFGYNGFGRLAGGSNNIGGATSGITTLQPGLLRLFGTDVGGQIAWLLPLAVITGVTGLILFWRTRQADQRFFATMLFLTSLLFTAGVLSFMNGIFHAYYTVALVPFIAALTGVAAHIVTTTWHRPWLRYLGFVVMLISAVLACYLLNRSPTIAILGWVLLLCGLVSAALILRPLARQRVLRGLVVVTLLGGQLVYDLYTLTTAQLASIPVAGPTVVFPFTTGGLPVKPTYVPIQPRPATRIVTGDQDLLDTIINRDHTPRRWVIAQTSGLAAATTELKLRKPVLLLGGYAGKDPYPTLADFKTMVQHGDVGYYYLAGEPQILDDGQLTTVEQIEIWVVENYTPVKVNTGYLYDLQQ